MSANGVFSQPLTWAAPYFGVGSAARALGDLQRSAALLMGRGTYELFSVQWPAASGDYADYINGADPGLASLTYRPSTEGSR